MQKEKVIELLENQLSAFADVFEYFDDDDYDNYNEVVNDANEWKINTERIIKQIFGNNSHYLSDFNNNFSDLSELHDTLYPIISYQTKGKNIEDDKIVQNVFTKLCLRFANAIKFIESMIEEIKNSNDLDESIATNPLSKIKNICNRFHLIASQIRARHENRPTIEIEDEYDVQDLLHAILKLNFDDIRPEEWTPSYAGKSARMDFLLKKEKIIIEVKKTRKGLTGKEVGDQLIIDIQRYQQHPDCKYLICFIYDPEGRIPNPKGIENDLSKTEEGIEIITIITPKGL